MFLSMPERETDQILLQRYARERCGAAFPELVQRHADLVYAAALRRMMGATGAAALLPSVLCHRVLVTAPQHVVDTSCLLADAMNELRTRIAPPSDRPAQR
jgi:hypothetical protein